ncbi:uncharacterized protein METZ01_LOCUS118155 [marine metagenome]|uniref:FAD-binding FR-type domain-containing protein n=1 Tax=marine metagenome TaxID=408172 RepID=A0A381XLI0_9ZZZZ
MNSQNETPSTPRRRSPPRPVNVVAVRQLSPHAVRVKFGGEQLKGFEPKGPAEHLRVFFPDPTSGKLTLPVLGPEGYSFPEDSERPPSRTFTPRTWNPETTELEIDFVLHGQGIASQWAANVKPGDQAVISGRPQGTYLLDHDADWYILAGDETALPAIATIIETLPVSIPAQVYIEVLDNAEEQELPNLPLVQVFWLHRDSNKASPGQMLLSALRHISIPEGNGYVWIGCEASVVRAAKKYFIEDLLLDETTIHAQGYWQQGNLNHPDHDVA